MCEPRAAPRFRCAPSPRRGEGWGEGVTHLSRGRSPSPNGRGSIPSLPPCLGIIIAAAIALTSASTAHAADRIRVAVQRTGTLAWELDVIKVHGLDLKAGLQIDALELAS